MAWLFLACVLQCVEVTAVAWVTTSHVRYCELLCSWTYLALYLSHILPVQLQWCNVISIDSQLRKLSRKWFVTFSQAYFELLIIDNQWFKYCCWSDCTVWVRKCALSASWTLWWRILWGLIPRCKVWRWTTAFLWVVILDGKRRWVFQGSKIKFCSAKTWRCACSLVMLVVGILHVSSDAEIPPKTLSSIEWVWVRHGLKWNAKKSGMFWAPWSVIVDQSKKIMIFLNVCGKKKKKKMR